MDSRFKKFAPFSLYLAIAAAIVMGGLYIVQREFNLYIQISLALFVVGLAGYVILDPDSVRQFLTGRQARYGSNAVLLSIAFVGILVVVNYLVYQNSTRWDLTEDQQNTLTDETQATLDTLEQPIQVSAFYTPDLPTTTAETLLDNFGFYAGDNFEYQFIDPLTEPVAAQQAGITQNGTLVVQYGERSEQITNPSEMELTSAIIRLISGEERVVYFLTGHGELSPNETGEAGYYQVKSTLERKNYKVEMLSLLSTNTIPEDASLIVIDGPSQPVSENEIALISEYLDAGGSLIVMEEPTIVTNFGDSIDPLAEYLNANWGIELGNNIVIDTTSSQPFVAYANSYASHPVTEEVGQVSTAFPTVRSVTVSENAPVDVNATELILTAAQTWAETDLDSLANNEEPTASEDDLIGPISLAVLAEKSAGSRVAVFGDVQFATDDNFNYLGNGDLIVNTVDWAVGQEELIDLTPRTAMQRLLLPPQPYTMNLILLGTVFLMPGIVLVAGIVVWIQRRRRG